MKSRRKHTRATIVDVAKQANVSTMTVSRVIRNHGTVSSSTRKRVDQAIAKLGYSPNLVARALVGSGAMRICLFFDNPSTAYLSQLVVGALKATSAAGANLIIEQFTATTTIDSLAKHFHQDWDGLIIPPPMSDRADVRELLALENFPAVFLSSAVDDNGNAHPLREIKIDDYAAAYDITRLLINKHHQRIGFITGDVSQAASEKRLQGYQQALRDEGITFREKYVENGMFDYQSGEQAAIKLLSLKQPPSAIFASNDDMAAGVIAGAKRMGLSIPEELAIVGFDDSAIASIVSPALTTVRQPVAFIAEQAVNWILNKDLNTQSPRIRWMEHAIIERETT